MIIYSVILFAASALLAVLGLLIFKGNAKLINCYREEAVVDKATYCRKIAQSLWFLAAVMIISSGIGLLGEAEPVALWAVGVLVAGVTLGIIRLFRVQNQYGGGVF